MSNFLIASTKSTLLIFGLVLCQLGNAQSKTAEITDGRPILKAINMLESIYDVPISFEDSRYVNDRLLVDITAQVQRTPNPSHKIMGLKTRTLSYTYQLPPVPPHTVNGWRQTRQEREAKTADALQSILEGYAAAGGQESFSVTKEAELFRVTANNFVNADGQLRKLPPILDTKITILPGHRTRKVLLNAICQAISKASGTHVGIWNFPYNSGSIQIQGLTDISGTDVPARSLLGQLLAEMDTQTSTKYELWNTAWIVGGGANADYLLTFHHVIQKDK
jgi:hypothetical protein